MKATDKPLDEHDQKHHRGGELIELSPTKLKLAEVVNQSYD